MLNLILFREKLRAFYARHGNVIIPVLHFAVALLALVLLNNGMGYCSRWFPPFSPGVGFACCSASVCCSIFLRSPRSLR